MTKPARKPTWLFDNPRAQDHRTPEGHPEQVARITAIRAALEDAQFAALHRVDAPIGNETDLRLCHPQSHIDHIKAAAAQGEGALDADTFVCAASWEAALRGVGGMIAAVDAVIDGQAANAFVATRPPGHHAESDRAMGFCLFGTAAIGAMHALDRRGLHRVAVLDFDVHHGNGTQDLLWNEPRAMFISSHQMPLYPGTGAAHERGAHGQIVNLPLPPNSGGAEMRRAWADHALPALEKFAPELVILSAGFDAHIDDPLANLRWQTEDFAWLTAAICACAKSLCGGRVVSTLEGGYDLPALGASVAAHMRALMEAQT